MGEGCGCWVHAPGCGVECSSPSGAGDGVPWGGVCRVVTTPVGTAWTSCFLHGTSVTPSHWGDLLYVHPRTWHPPCRQAGSGGVRIPSTVGTPVHTHHTHTPRSILLPTMPGTWMPSKDTERPCCPPRLTPSQTSAPLGTCPWA